VSCVVLFLLCVCVCDLLIFSQHPARAAYGDGEASVGGIGLGLTRFVHKRLEVNEYLDLFTASFACCVRRWRSFCRVNLFLVSCVLLSCACACDLLIVLEGLG